MGADRPPPELVVLARVEHGRDVLVGRAEPSELEVLAVGVGEAQAGDPLLHQRTGQAGQVDPVDGPHRAFDSEHRGVPNVDVVPVAVGPVERHDQVGADVVDDRRDRRRDAIERCRDEGRSSTSPAIPESS